MTRVAVSCLCLVLLPAAACRDDRPVALGDSGGPPGPPAPTGPTGPTPPDLQDLTTPEVLASEPCEACGGDCVVEELSYPSSVHVTEPIDYADVPPAGGPHDPCWAEFGVHEAPVEDDRWVHNLEHGGVVYLYDCPAGCPDEAAALAALAADRPFVLVTPYAGAERPYAAVAWGVRMLAGCVDPAAFAAFHEDHVDRAPESISSGPPDACP